MFDLGLEHLSLLLFDFSFAHRGLRTLPIKHLELQRLFITPHHNLVDFMLDFVCL